ncbi:hypothetical protein BKA64DRAFT_58994 [Cadophora sp. MPI-SDFR-AT-0126]|nr:hypothetical protein BKA64DRAFT_58994 [Leotiomycetes sp. MPI-SDFR-AT-0126]
MRAHTLNPACTRWFRWAAVFTVGSLGVAQSGLLHVLMVLSRRDWTICGRWLREGAAESWKGCAWWTATLMIVGNKECIENEDINKGQSVQQSLIETRNQAIKKLGCVMGGQRGTVTQSLVFLSEVGRRESRWQGTEASREQHARPRLWR